MFILNVLECFILDVLKFNPKYSTYCSARKECIEMLCVKRIEIFNFENYSNVSRETFYVF